MIETAIAQATKMPPDQAFPGPRAFLPSESVQFRGRMREVEDLHDLLLSYRSVLLYAKSGAGKTSLVNAGLLQQIGRDHVQMCRVGGALPAMVAEGTNIFVLNALLSAASQTLPINELLNSPHLQFGSVKLSDLSLPNADPAVLVFDQFEEIFTQFPERWQDREPFFRELRDLLANRPEIHLLLVIREDHIAELDNYATFLPDHLRIRYHLDALRQSSAEQAIREPARLCGYDFDAGVLEALVTDLRKVPVKVSGHVIQVEGEFIEPLHLQVVCRRLFAKLPSGRNITHADVHAFADVDDALAHYYDQAIERTVAASRVSEYKLRRWFSNEIITPAGTRGTVFADESKAGSIPVAATVELDREKVLRSELRAGATWYELTHDRFIGPILKTNAEWFQRRTKWRNGIVLAVILSVAATAFSLLYYKSTSELPASQVEEVKNSAREEGYKNAQQAAQKEIRQIKQEQQSSANLLARTLASPTGAPVRVERGAALSMALAAQGLASITLGDLGGGKRYFDRSRAMDAMAPIKVLDKAIAEAGTQDPLLADLRIARRDYLESFDPFAQPNPVVRRYACEHNAFVIGASDTVANAPGELKRWQRTYPYAELGVPTSANPKWVPIIIASFLTCEDARKFIVDLKNKQPRSEPFVGAWYSQCPACSGVPRRIGERNPVSSRGPQ